MITFYDIVLYFSLFSFCGWICESVFCSIHEKKLVNRGFLNGPVCPIYGFGGLMVVYILAPLQNNLVLLFLCGLITTTALEYATSWLMEKLFHTSWWDYSDLKFNLNGRVCLKFSIIFGLLSVVAVKLLYPPFFSMVAKIPLWAKPWLGWGLTISLLADAGMTVYGILSLNGKLEELKATALEIRQKVEGAGVYMSSQEWRERFRLEPSQLSPEALRDALDDLTKRMETQLQGFAKRFQNRRLMNAFPKMRSTRNTEQFYDVKAAWEALKKRRKKKK